MKEIKKTVDHHLPKWLHSKILTAVDFIWQVKNDDQKTMARISQSNIMQKSITS